MVNDFGRRAQRDADHSNVPDTSDASQPDLLDLLANISGQADADADPTLTTAERFEQFHAENPHVYRAMVLLCRRWVARFGRSKVGINSVVETARWEVKFTTNDPAYKINNSWAPWFSRLIMLQEPDLNGIFDLRRAPEADAWIAEKAAQVHDNGQAAA